MNTPFRYRPITEKLLRDVYTWLDNGESVSLLGPRYGGKRYVLRWAMDRFEEDRKGPIISFCRFGSSGIRTKTELRAMIMKEAGESCFDPDQSSEDLLHCLAQLRERTGRRVFLFAANVDSLPHRLARHFLECVRKHVESRDIVAAISGDYDLSDLVYGPKSEFNAAHQIVTQGFDTDQFFLVFQRMAAALGLDVSEPKAVSDELCLRTGGSVAMLRSTLAVFADSNSRTEKTLRRPLAVDSIPEIPSSPAPAMAYWGHLARFASNVVARDPRSWGPLSLLLEKKEIALGLKDTAPTSLEFSGIAVRSGELADGQVLRFASEFAENLARTHFNPVRMGDLYARNQQWDMAFAHYAKPEPEWRIRPVGGDDRLEVEFAVNAVATKLYKEASKGPDKVREFFAKAVGLAFGVPSVIFLAQEGVWKPLTEVSPKEQAPLREIELYLPETDPHPGLYPLPEPLIGFAIAAVLPDAREGRSAAVVVGDLYTQETFSRERFKLIRDLVLHLVQAYTHAVSVAWERERRMDRDHHVTILNGILDSLGKKILDVESLVKVAAAGLKGSRYHRVEICLVDPKAERIQGIVDDSDDPTYDVAGNTDFLIHAPPFEDVQQWVVWNGLAYCTDCPGTDKLINPKVHEKVHLGPMAIVPMKAQSGSVTGTIHIERKDRTLPTSQEVDDLIEFGKSLSIAIELCLRANMLEQTLDKVPEPVAIVDQNQRITYANKSASDQYMLGRPGWRYLGDREVLPEQLGKFFEDERRLNTRVVRWVPFIVGTNVDRRSAVIVDSLTGWKKHRVGAFFHEEDLTHIQRLFDALNLVAHAKDFLETKLYILDACRLLGHPRARLYLLDGQDVLKGILGVGNPELDTEFSTGRVVLFRPQEHKDSFQCLDEKRPCAFVFRPKGVEGRSEITELGLELYVVTNPTDSPCLPKAEGDVWIDLPLIAEGRIIGKLTVEADSNTNPEHFQTLVVLSDGLAQRLRGAATQETWVRVRAVEEAMAIFAHNISTRMASLPDILHDYRSLESEVPRIRDLNNHLQLGLDGAKDAVNRVKASLGRIEFKNNEFDICGEMRDFVSKHIDVPEFDLKAPDTPMMIWADGSLLVGALLELVKNSHDVASKPHSISLTRYDDRDRSWVRLTYKDSGKGVPAELKTRIFEACFSTRRGTGLGLTFTRRVIEGSGGRIKECGTPGIGATFVIELPLQPVKGI